MHLVRSGNLTRSVQIKNHRSKQIRPLNLVNLRRYCTDMVWPAQFQIKTDLTCSGPIQAFRFGYVSTRIWHFHEGSHRDPSTRASFTFSFCNCTTPFVQFHLQNYRTTHLLCSVLSVKYHSWKNFCRMLRMQRWFHISKGQFKNTVGSKETRTGGQVSPHRIIWFWFRFQLWPAFHRLLLVFADFLLKNYSETSIYRFWMYWFPRSIIPLLWSLINVTLFIVSCIYRFLIPIIFFRYPIKNDKSRFCYTEQMLQNSAVQILFFLQWFCGSIFYSSCHTID